MSADLTAAVADLADAMHGIRARLDEEAERDAQEREASKRPTDEDYNEALSSLLTAAKSFGLTDDQLRAFLTSDDVNPYYLEVVVKRRRADW